MVNLTITLDERPSFDINSEDYRFRVKIAEVIDEIDIRCRDMAIEDHHNQTKHKKPHLQFKLHADGIGPIHIFIPISTIEEYKKYILSFLDIIGSILIKLDNKNKELQTKFMIMDNFKKIEGMRENIQQLVFDKYKNKELKLLTFDKKERNMNDEDIKKLKSIPQIAPFFENIN
ncbi:hypothetical protein HYT54_04815 [Candidatus Woesearchaeota archaeon]|nr:hypothetical protein [Candidatus Woesearchaeota archaeon]